MPAARPTKKRAAAPPPPAVDPNPTFQLTFPSPGTLAATLPATARSAESTCGSGALALQTTISFAPNITPGTFTAPPQSDDDLLRLDAARNASGSQSTLFPDAAFIDGLAKPPAAKRRKKATPANASRATPVPSKAASKKSTKSLIHPSPSSSKSPSPSPSTSSSSTAKSPLTSNDPATPAHIPRPPNAFILFRSSFIRSQHVSAETEGNHGTLSKIVGMLWHALSYEERQVWQAKARRAYAEHRRMYPDYSFRPVKDKSATTTSSSTSNASSSSNATLPTKSEREATPLPSNPTGESAPAAPAKRKTRAVGPRDLQRCEHIAALLARGLKGAKLDAAMREFDASRAPQAYTPRFEVPLTAQTYATPKEEPKEESIGEEKGMGESEVKMVEVETVTTTPKAKTEKPTAPRSQTPQPASYAETPAALALLRPGRVRRSSSAPLLDASLPLSAPAPLYPTANFFHPYQQMPQQQAFVANGQEGGMYDFGQQQQQQHQEQQQPQSAYPTYGYLNQSQIVQDGTALRKRSASSSPPLRRPSYSFANSAAAFAYPQAHPNLASYNFTAPAPQPQPLGHAYAHAHPHLHQIQARAQQAQSQAHGQQEPAQAFGLGLEFGDPQAGENVNGSGYWNEPVDFGGFSFSQSDGRETPVSAHPHQQANPSPFDATSMSAAPSSTNVEDLEYDYSGMPVLVDAPPMSMQGHGHGAYGQHDYYNHARGHPHLEIQTSWSGEEYSFDGQVPTSAASVPPSSALDLDMESVPPSAVSGAFEFPPVCAPVPSTMESGYAVATTMPFSPSSGSGAPSSAGARTPIDDTFGAWDQSQGSTVASVMSPVGTYDGCSSQVDESTMHARVVAIRAVMEQMGKGIGAGAGSFDEPEAAVCGGAAYEQFARFVQSGGMEMLGGIEMGLGGMNTFGGVSEQAPMADVM